MMMESAQSLTKSAGALNQTISGLGKFGLPVESLTILTTSTQFIVGGSKVFTGIRKIVDAKTLAIQAETIAQAAKWGPIGIGILATAYASGYYVGEYLENTINSIDETSIGA